MAFHQIRLRTSRDQTSRIPNLTANNIADSSDSSDNSTPCVYNKNTFSGRNFIKKGLARSASLNSRIPVLIRSARQNNIPPTQTDLGSDGDTPTVSSSSRSTSNGSPEVYTPTSALSLLDRSMMPILHLPSNAPDISNIIKRFPSTRSTHKFVDWTDLKNAKSDTTDEQISQAFQTARFLDQVRHIFDSHGETLENSRHEIKRTTETQYLSNNFKHEMRKEELIKDVFEKTNTSPTLTQKQLRKKRIEWIVEAGCQFELNLETIHMAVFYMDLFLLRNDVSSEKESNSLALTAFYLAMKMEEVQLVRLKDIVEAFDTIFEGTSAKTTRAVERKLLTALKFQLYPPSSQVMVDIVLQSGVLNFQDSSMKTYVHDLALELLLISIKDIAHFQIRPSIKARLALEVALEYVMYNWNIFRQFDSTSTGATPDDLKVRRARCYCDMTYRELLEQAKK